MVCPFFTAIGIYFARFKNHRSLYVIYGDMDYDPLRITAIKLSDLVPSPLREKVGMRGNLKAFSHFDSPHPGPLPLERAFSSLT